jgi:O-antigen/teichoic acid export membrane protein
MQDSPPPSRQLKQKALRGVAWSFAEKGGTQATQFVTFLILARLLRPDAFGLISLANVFIHFIQALTNSGFSEAIVQHKDVKPEHLDSAFWANLSIGVLITGLGIWGASGIAIFFKEPALTPIIQCLSLNVLIRSFADIQQATLKRELNFRGLTVRQLVGMVAGSIVGVTMAILDFGVWSLVFQTLVSNLVGTLLLWKISHWRPSFRFSVLHLKELFSFGINVFGISILVFLNRRGDDFLIGYFLGATALGYYTIAYKMFVTVMQILQETTQKVSLPTLSRLQDDLPQLRQVFYTSTSLVSLVGVPAFLGLATISPEFIRVSFGEQWIPSIPVMQILSLNGVLVILMSFSGPTIMALGKPSWNLRLLLMNTVVKVAAFLAVVQYGIVWVAGALVASNYIVWPAYLWALRKLLSIELFVLIRRLTPIFIATVLMCGAILGLKSLISAQVNLQTLLFLSIVLGVIIYGSAIALLGPQLFQKAFGLIQMTLPNKELHK